MRFYIPIMHATATLCGVGYLPLMPGTYASIITALLLFYLQLDASIVILLLVGLVFFGTWAASVIEKHNGHNDPSYIVIDEVIGMLCVLVNCQRVWWVYVLAVALFRFFDIVKPFPIKQSENFFSGGTAIVIDDIIAGVYARVCLFLIMLFSSV